MMVRPIHSQFMNRTAHILQLNQKTREKKPQLIALCFIAFLYLFLPVGKSLVTVHAAGLNLESEQLEHSDCYMTDIKELTNSIEYLAELTETYPVPPTEIPTVSPTEQSPATQTPLPPTPTQDPSPTTTAVHLPEMTETPTLIPTQTMLPSSTPTPTLIPSLTSTTIPTPTPTSAYIRPLLVVESYTIENNQVKPGEQVKLHLQLNNIGQAPAHNILLAFQSSDLLPLQTGGVIAILSLASGERAGIDQLFSAPTSLTGQDYAGLTLKLSYVDPNGIPYTSDHNLNFPVKKAPVSIFIPTATSTLTPTPTATALPGRPHLVITVYTTDINPLQAGTPFLLNLSVRNQGLIIARQITLIIGGGKASYNSPIGSGNGISGAGADFSTFAPLNSSNIQYIGDINPLAGVDCEQPLIVNAATKPGVYSMVVSFAYFDDDGNAYLDEGVITLLVHHLPRLDVGFYRPVPPIQAGGPQTIPLQIMNLDKNPIMIDRMIVSSPHGFIETPPVYIGILDGGGYFTQDIVITPDAQQLSSISVAEVVISLEYVDHFNQPQVIIKTINLEVELKVGAAVPVEEISLPDSQATLPPSSANLIKMPIAMLLWRLFLGFIGLDSHLS